MAQGVVVESSTVDWRSSGPQQVLGSGPVACGQLQWPGGRLHALWAVGERFSAAFCPVSAGFRQRAGGLWLLAAALGVVCGSPAADCSCPAAVGSGLQCRGWMGSVRLLPPRLSWARAAVGRPVGLTLGWVSLGSLQPLGWLQPLCLWGFRAPHADCRGV